MLDDLKAWLEASLARVSGKSELAGAIRYARSRWAQLTCYRDRGVQGAQVGCQHRLLCR